MPHDPPSIDASDLAQLCSLEDPTRRRLYAFVAGRDQPVSRDQASEALGIERPVAAYHLDQLVDHGLLMTSFARPEGRSGPGAGRPTKYYQQAATEVAVSVPARDYPLVAELLARAVEADTSGTVRASLDDAAAAFGREMAGSSTGESDLVDHLDRQGFEPFDDGGVVRLRNCPFHRLARQHAELICGMNLAMLSALATTVGAERRAVLEPLPSRCCVAFVPTKAE